MSPAPERGLRWPTSSAAIRNGDDAWRVTPQLLVRRPHLVCAESRRLTEGVDQHRRLVTPRSVPLPYLLPDPWVNGVGQGRRCRAAAWLRPDGEWLVHLCPALGAGAAR